MAGRSVQVDAGQSRECGCNKPLTSRDVVRCSGSYKPAHGCRRLGRHRRRRRQIRRYARYFPARLLDSVPAEMAVSGRSACVLRSSRPLPFRSIKSARCQRPLLLPQRWNAELIFTRRRLIPLVLDDSSRGTINWCMTEVICDLPLVKVQSGRHDRENGSDKDNN